MMHYRRLAVAYSGRAALELQPHEIAAIIFLMREQFQGLRESNRLGELALQRSKGKDRDIPGRRFGYALNGLTTAEIAELEQVKPQAVRDSVALALARFSLLMSRPQYEDEFAIDAIEP